MGVAHPSGTGDPDDLSPELMIGLGVSLKPNWSESWTGWLSFHSKGCVQELLISSAADFKVM